MFNLDNVIYFPGNIDVRICPKNGLLSTKQLFMDVLYVTDIQAREKRAVMWNYHEQKLKNPSLSVIGSAYRWQQVLENSNSIDFPFRKNSTKIAIKRDPVERFKSGVEMLQAFYKSNFKFDEHSIFSSEKKYRIYDSISTLIDDLEKGKLSETHLFTQSYFLGDKSKYDIVYDINEFTDFIKMILYASGIEWDETWYVHKNISNNTSKEKYDELIKINKAPFPYIERSFNSDYNHKHITKFMTDEDIYRVKKLYKVDYDNGWC